MVRHRIRWIGKQPKIAFLQLGAFPAPAWDPMDVGPNGPLDRGRWPKQRGFEERATRGRVFRLSDSQFPAYHLLIGRQNRDFGVPFCYSGPKTR